MYATNTSPVEWSYLPLYKVVRPFNPKVSKIQYVKIMRILLCPWIQAQNILRGWREYVIFQIDITLPLQKRLWYLIGLATMLFCIELLSLRARQSVVQLEDKK